MRWHLYYVSVGVVWSFIMIVLTILAWFVLTVCTTLFLFGILVNIILAIEEEYDSVKGGIILTSMFGMFAIGAFISLLALYS